MAGQAKIVGFRCTIGRQQQLVLVRRSVRVVALNAITNRWRVNFPLDAGGILVGVAGNAQRLGAGGNQLYAGYVFVRAYFMTAHAAQRNCRVHRLAFGFIFVTLNAR